MIKSFFENIFPYEKFPVEYECFVQLRNSELNYIAVPWTQILNSHWLSYPNKQSPESYFKILSNFVSNQKDNFTVCQHDNYLALENYYKHLNITKVFTPLRDITERQIPGIEFIPIPFTNAFNFAFPSKDLLFSFVGTYTSHPIRERMRNRIVGKGITYRDQYHVCTEMFFKENQKQKEEEEYQRTMERSAFSLCPRGSSCSSVRFWESIHAHSIPVLISDNWLLPNWDWDNTIIRLSEKEFDSMSYDDISRLLKSVSVERYSRLLENVKKASLAFHQKRFGDYIKSNI